jgi:hypothetical protein
MYSKEGDMYKTFLWTPTGGGGLHQYSVLIGIQCTKTQMELVIPKREWDNNNY